MNSTRALDCTIVGVLNATPDSFSDGGRHSSVEAAAAFGRQLAADGAEIIDIGGEATGPGSTPVAEAEELRRVCPLVQTLAGEHVLSVDTVKAAVADAVLSRGAAVINDVSAMRFDPEMAAVVRQHGAKVILMYSKEPAESPHVSDTEVQYSDAPNDIRRFLEERINYAIGAGIEESNIIIDPGMGRFVSSDPEVSWLVLRELKKIVDLGFPVMIGTSRKGFLGGAVDNRELSSALTSLHAALKGVKFIRTHNPRLTLQALDTWSRLGDATLFRCG